MLCSTGARHPHMPHSPPHRAHSNRCAALLKISKFSKALDDAHTVIRLRPDWDKGYFRKASVLEAMGRPEEVRCWLVKQGMSCMSPPPHRRCKCTTRRSV